MIAAVVAALSVALAIAVFVAPARWTFIGLLASIVLVPDSLAVPVAVTAQLTVHRLILLAVLARVVWRAGTGQESSRLFRPTSASLALSAYVAVTLLVGVAMAAPGTSLPTALTAWLAVLEQLVTLIVVTALVREMASPTDVVTPILGVLGVSAAIGVIEHVTGASWGHLLFSGLHSQQGTAAAQPLAVRDGATRVRAGADYPLGFAWTCAALLPVAVAWVTRRRVLLLPALVLLGLVLGGVYWSGTRSALIGVAVAVLFVGLTAGTRRVSLLAIGLLVAGAIAFAALPAFSAHFSIAVDPGSVAVREQRLPIVTGAVAGRPLLGLGLGGTQLLGLQGLDASYLLTYAQTGAIGLAALGAALLVALIAVGRGLRGRGVSRSEQVLGSAAFAGAITIIVSGIAFDVFSLPGVADVMWVLVGVGVVVAERARGPERLLRRWPAVAATTAAAALVGGVVALAVGPAVSQTYDFTVLPGGADAVPYDPVVPANTLIAATCSGFQTASNTLAGVSVDCRNLYAGFGLGQVRVAAPSRAALTSAVGRLQSTAVRYGVPHLQLLPMGPAVSARPTGTRWLPVSLAVFAALVALTAPLHRRERSARPLPGLRPLPALVPAR